MKKSIFFSIVLCLALAATSAIAQQKKFEFVVGGGIGAPLNPSDFTDAFKLGLDGRIGAGYLLSPQFALGINLGFNNFGLDKDFLNNVEEIPAGLDFKIDGGNLRVYEVASMAKWYTLPSQNSTNFYLLGGPGVAFTRLSDLTITAVGETIKLDGENDTNFLLTGGAGIKQRLNNNLSVFLEGRYSHLFASGDDASYIPVRIGVTF